MTQYNNKLRHIMLERLDDNIRVYDPGKGRFEDFSRYLWDVGMLPPVTDRDEAHFEAALKELNNILDEYLK